MCHIAQRPGVIESNKATTFLQWECEGKPIFSLFRCINSDVFTPFIDLDTNTHIVSPFPCVENLLLVPDLPYNGFVRNFEVFFPNHSEKVWLP